jgi:hypothetical protein
MPAKEVKVVRALGTVDPFNAVNNWWTYQQKMWHELRKSTIDFSPYTKGKFADPTVDLRPDARFTNAMPGENWYQPAYDDSKWTPAPLSSFRFWGAEPGKPLWVRKTFTVPDDWQHGGGQIRLIVGLKGEGSAGDPAEVKLNGKSLHDIGGDFADGLADVDATKAVTGGVNVLTLEYQGKSQVQAVMGDVYLYLRREPVKSLPLGLGVQSVLVPKSWEGKYKVMLYLEGERYAINDANVNDHLLMRARPFAAPAEFNLTAYLKYGAQNTIRIGPGKSPADFKVARLDLFPINNE